MNEMTTEKPARKFNWLYDLLFVLVLAAAAFLRFTGSAWGELQYQHPDELFFTSVTLDIAPVGTSTDVIGPAPTAASQPWRAAFPKAFPDCPSWGGYFNTACSPLNPQNRGHAFYVYGDLPVFIVRGLADLSCQPLAAQLHIPCQLNSMQLFGRYMSAVMDLLTVALLYILAARLYNRRVALLTAAFSAFAVMQIQQSHFYTVDNFITFFMLLAAFFAVAILTGKYNLLAEGRETGQEEGSARFSGVTAFFSSLVRDRVAWLSIGFGVAFGMAVASKLNAAPLALLLPAVILVRYYKQAREGNRKLGEIDWYRILAYLVLGGVASLLSFRVFQPYAFYGLFGINPQWLANIREVRAQASPSTDMPWALQWAKRTHLYSFQNLTIWGLGLPLGILAWVGFLWMGWISLRAALRGEWSQHLPLWIWTAFYFGWQSLQYNPTMRYQLPIYPLLALMAGWFVFELARWKIKTFKRFNVSTFLASTLGIIVLILTGAWAFAFSRIYTRPETRVAASNWIFQNVAGPINVRIQGGDGSTYQQPLPVAAGTPIRPDLPFQTVFVAQTGGTVSEILLGHAVDSLVSGTQTLTLTLATLSNPTPDQVLASASATADFAATSDPRGRPVMLTLDHPLVLENGITYYLTFQTSGGSIVLSGDSFANETDYDWSLPFRISGYDPFGGIYRGDLNLQVYWDDNTDKLPHFESVLDQADYIFIPTNHQYGQITRLPERYPLTTAYYRDLIGCPPDKSIIWCYRVAEPGMFQGSLGFDLVATFEDYPNLGSFRINDQAAEEAFTFYDHPKVLVFHKNPDFDPARLAAVLGAVDISHAVHLNPGQADHYKSLLLPADRLAVQQAGGTWSQLFNTQALYNRYPVLGVVLWYVVIFLIGLFAYPLVRAAMPGLSDGGYPLARVAGLLLWSWLAWMAGSLGLTYSKTTIAVAFGLVGLIGAWQAWHQREELKREFRRRWKLFLLIELLFLAFFLLDLFIRLGNPDLWHPAKGGERPMDFAFFNAILKSTTFPPYDPWFAGGYINYYYYGYVIVATPVKLLGIVPSIAFNFILPTLFACLAVAAFSVAWNLFDRKKPAAEADETAEAWHLPRLPLFTGLSASAAMVLIGNLGIVRMFYQGFQRLSAPGGLIDQANIFVRIWWALKGFFLAVAGGNVPYGPGDWYWFPSRALPASSGGPITEFPLFTFLYSDLHAHMIAMMLTVLAIAWAASVLLSKARWKGWQEALLGLFLGGLVIGALRPTNTWDFYTYLALGCIVLAYATWRYAPLDWIKLPLPDWAKRLLLTGGALVILVGLTQLLFAPFSHWYSQEYNSLESWKGSRSDLSSYLVHWGTFLFFIVSWMVWETRQWLAETPLSALRKLRPYRELIIGGLVGVLVFLVAQQAWVMSPKQNVPWKGVSILWLAVPLAIWAAVLLFRPGISDEKRLVLFMVGTSLLLTMVVELLVVSGDIGRQNTVFKFYVQAWIMLGISAAAAFGWLLLELRKWLPGWRTAWNVAAVALTAGAVLFLVVAGADKIRDRMNPNAPHTLDSMTYMAYAHYSEYGVDMDLSEDYRAIRWMQENVQGSPVIVEAAAAGVQYTWLSRYSIYTGLPDVIGWEWHEEQQRVLFGADVMNRGRVEVDGFYATTDVQAALDFLHRYNVRYIIVGQLERAKYAPGASLGPVPAGAPDGLAKFDAYNGIFWNQVYRDGQTVIYEVPAEGEVTP